MKRYIFLDIDGVIAGDNDWGRRIADGSCAFNNGAIRALTRVFDEVPDTEIVISSTWRKGETVASLRDIFKLRGFKYYYRIIDKTPVLQLEQQEGIPYSCCPRGVEIETWIRMNTAGVDQYRYCIIDDGSDMLYYQRDNFVHIHHTELFNEKYALKTIDILKGVQ